MRVELDGVADCSQMSDPVHGRGSGFDRCEESDLAMIDKTLKLGVRAKAGWTGEQIMLSITEAWNNGSDRSVPEPASKMVAWLADYGISCQYLPVDESNYQAAIDRGHMVILGVPNYGLLTLSNGSNPYNWQPEHLGHALLGVGYDTDTSARIVHDPLRADPGGQPADYSEASFVAAGWNVNLEVLSSPLRFKLEPVSPPPPAPAQEPGTYVIKEGDSLFEIARSLGLHDWYGQLYTPNADVLNEAAQDYGHPDSQGGNLIFPGMVLHYKV